MEKWRKKIESELDSAEYFIETDNLSLKFKTWVLDITVPELFNLWAIN